MVLFTMTNVIPVTMKLIEMCGGGAKSKSPQFICIFTKATLIGTVVLGANICISKACSVDGLPGVH